MFRNLQYPIESIPTISALYSLLLWIICPIVLAQAPLVGFSEDDLEEDEAGIWMIVERQEQEIRTSSILIDDSELNSLVNTILCELVQESCEYLRSYVIRAPGFNAFMMPNGAFYIQSGLLLRVKNDDQLAAVIGHEASHYFRSHTIESFRNANARGNTLAVLGAVVNAASFASLRAASNVSQLASSVQITNTAAAMLQTAQILVALQLLSYSRSDETEADLDGIEWMVNAQRNPFEAIRVWEQLIIEQASAGKNFGFSLLSTHPAPERRILDLADRINAMEGTVADTSETYVISLVENYREDWLLDEMVVLHPDQFQYVIELQVELGMPEYLANYFAALAYSNALSEDRFSRRSKRGFSEKALAQFELATSFSEANLRPEIYRDYGKFLEETGQIDESKVAYRTYLELDPDAWDARFIGKKLEP